MTRRLYEVIIISKETDEVLMDKKVVAESELAALNKVNGSIYDATGMFVDLVIKNLVTIQSDESNSKNLKVVTKITGVMNAWKYYRKKPVVVKAVLIDETILIETLEGTMTGNPGDYLIEGVNKELYPCKPDIFKKTYEEE